MLAIREWLERKKKQHLFGGVILLELLWIVIGLWLKADLDISLPSISIAMKMHALFVSFFAGASYCVYCIKHSEFQYIHQSLVDPGLCICLMGMCYFVSHFVAPWIGAKMGIWMDIVISQNDFIILGTWMADIACIFYVEFLYSHFGDIY